MAKSATTAAGSNLPVLAGQTSGRPGGPRAADDHRGDESWDDEWDESDPGAEIPWDELALEEPDDPVLDERDFWIEPDEDDE